MFSGFFCLSFGLPEPKFENIADGFMVTLYSVPDSVPDDLTDNQRKIIALLSENNRLSLADLGNLVGISKRKVLDNINVLKAKGLVERMGTPQKGFWKVEFSQIPSPLTAKEE